MHVGIFGAGFIALLVIRGILARRAAAMCTASGSPAVPYWPEQAARGTIACSAVLFILLLAFQHGISLPCPGEPLPHAGVQLLSPADTDPANGYNAARPEWFLVGVYEFSHRFPGGILMNIPIFIVPGFLVAMALAMPFLAKHFLGQIFNIAFTIALLVALFGMTWYSYSKDQNDEAHQLTIAKEKKQAARVHELAWCNGIPPTGALTLLRDDPKTQGPRLFTQNCASCHDHAAEGDDAIKSEKPSAPDLAGFASRKWIAGLLDPKQVAGPKYFGNTKLRKMAAFVKENMSELDDEQKKSLEKLVKALSAEAQLRSQRELDAKDAKGIAEGRVALTDEFGCVNCHKFHDKPGVSDTPDLTGYGSAKWIAGIVSNPADKRYYGKYNDRMPAYAASADPAQNTLNEKQIQMLHGLAPG